MKNHLHNLLIIFVFLLAAAGSGRAQAITSLSPTSGASGTEVTINGTNLSNTTSVLLRGIPCKVTPVSATQVRFIVPAAASGGPVRLTTPGGTALSPAAFAVTRVGGLGFPLVTETFNGFSVGAWSKPTFTDLDGDGLLDMLVGGDAGNLNHYEQGAPNSARFTRVDERFNGIDVGSYSAPTFTDLDGDGLLDLLVGGDAGNLNHYEQDAPNATSFTRVTETFNGIYVGASAPTFTDLDGDGLLDLLVGGVGGTLNHYEQDAPNATGFTLVTKTFNSLDVGSYSAPTFTDLDGDGLLDLLVGGFFGNLNHYEQDAPNATSFTRVTGSFNGIAVGNYSTPTFTDLDGDGLLDLLVGEFLGRLNHYEQALAITITSFAPTSGPVGTNITVTGTNLGGATAARVNGTAGTITANDATGLTFTVAAGSITGPVSITTNGGTATGGDFTVQNAPTALTLSNNTVAENVAANTTVGTLSTTDPDVGDSFTYTLASGAGDGDNTAFTISGNELRITASPDFEAKSSYAVRVRTTDAGGLFFEQNFTISVTNVNEAPTIAAQTFSIPENSASGTTVGTVAASDPDAGTTLSYSITNGNTGGAFSFAGNALRVANAAALDFETTPSFTLTVQVSDGDLTASATVTVNLTDVDDIAPTVIITSTASSPTTTSPIPVTITFSEDVTGFEAGDVMVTGGTAGNFSGSGSSYTLGITPGGSGMVTVDVAANVAQDGVGNGNLAANQFSIQFIQLLAPTVTTAAPTNITSGSATLGGSVTADGGASVTKRGVVYVTGDGTPTTDDTKVAIGSGTGSFTQNVAGLMPGTLYSVRAYATNSAGTSYGEKRTFTTPASLAVAVGNQTGVSCFGGSDGSISVSASGGNPGYTYTLAPVGTQNGEGVFTGLAAGDYTVTVSDQAGGSASTGTITISQPAAITFGQPTVTGVTCFGTSTGSILVSASGGTGMIGYGLSGTNNNAYVSLDGSFNGLPADTYTLTATDANGCTATTSVSVTQPEALTFGQPTVSNVSCNGGSDGSISVTASVGTGPYTYTVGGSSNAGGTFTGLAAGSYPVSVTDANGCTASGGTIQVTQPAPLTLGAPMVANVSCFGGSDGSISVSASGGTSPYTYSVGGSSNAGGSFTGLAAGSYPVSVTDANGCTASGGTVSISQPAAVSLSTGGDASVILGYGESCVTLTAMGTGGTGSLTYAWMPGNLSGASVRVCPQVTTTYTVTATDANGCQSAPVQVTVTVKDFRCGPGNQNVAICYYGVTQCVPQKIAERYLKLGATLGACGSGGNTRVGVEESNAPFTLSLKAYPNPVQNAMTLEVLAPNAGTAIFEVIDLTGRSRQSRSENLVEGLNEVEFRLGGLPTGLYLIRAVDAFNRQGVVKVSKE